MRSIAYAGLNRSGSLGDEWVIDGENHQSVLVAFGQFGGARMFLLLRLLPISHFSSALPIHPPQSVAPCLLLNAHPLASRPLSSPYLDVPTSSLPFAAHSPSLAPPHPLHAREGSRACVCQRHVIHVWIPSGTGPRRTLNVLIFTGSICHCFNFRMALGVENGSPKVKAIGPRNESEAFPCL